MSPEEIEKICSEPMQTMDDATIGDHVLVLVDRRDVVDCKDNLTGKQGIYTGDWARFIHYSNPEDQDFVEVPFSRYTLEKLLDDGCLWDTDRIKAVAAKLGYKLPLSDHYPSRDIKIKQLAIQTVIADEATSSGFFVIQPVPRITFSDGSVLHGDECVWLNVQNHVLSVDEVDQALLYYMNKKKAENRLLDAFTDALMDNLEGTGLEQEIILRCVCGRCRDKVLNRHRKGIEPDERAAVAHQN